MKKLIYLILTVFLLGSCNEGTENQPLTGSKWGELRNGSAEQVVSSEVMYWSAESRHGSATHFYDFEAVDGTKSLTIFSNTPSNGR